MFKFAAMFAVATALFFTADVRESAAQVVTTYYAPAPVVGVVPVRRGVFGWRTGYAPVVAGTVPVPVTSYYAPAPVPVTSYYAPAPVPVTSYYAPAPVPVTSFYAPAPMVRTFYAPAPVPVTTFYAPPRIYVGR